MKLSRSKRDSSIAFNMTPMIDIVFLLIIFFMTVSQITRTVDHPVDLPVVKGGGAPSKPATVTINLTAKGQIVIGGRRATLPQTVAALKNQLALVKNDTLQIKVQIRCDRKCQARYVNRLVEELVLLGFQNVREAIAVE